ncbi:hypothetical protein B0I35DRAFT_510443 [Stachybotrys elegans]|uniref:Uncharacterized protein n=1 Tax=Stachybotrys elegans TaxID=80388 RepID=A0A8K0T1Z0_9HYPO|nr:hypothetical protein B0I35DRAFT_510443 [Stachybotrys elegans]
MPSDAKLWAAWLEVADLTHNSKDEVKAKCTEFPWLKNLLPPQKSSIELGAVRLAFDDNPMDFIDILRSFASALNAQERQVYMLNKYQDAFVFVCTEIRREHRLAQLSPEQPLEQWTQAWRLNTAMASEDKVRKTEHGTAMKSAIKRLHAYQQEYAPLLKNSDFASNSILETAFGNAKAHYESTLDMKMEFSNIVDWGFRNIKPTPKLLVGFHENIRYFTELVAGLTMEKQLLSLELCLDNLKQSAATRIRSLEPIYKEIQILRDTVERQNQIITSLQYRRYMEHIPNKAHYSNNSKLPPKEQSDSSTRYWKEVWIDLVELELSKMLSPSSVTTSPRPLTSLFQSEFDYWKRKQKGPLPKSVPQSVYMGWTSYRRGVMLYGEVSGNIHQYIGTSQSLYDIKESNWSNSERSLLAALKPSCFQTVDGVKDVDWTKERIQQGLP